MRCLIPCHSELRTIPLGIVAALVFTCCTATGTLAQHAGGYVGGAGHVGAPHASHPAGPLSPVRPPVIGPGTRNAMVRPPAFQILPPPNFRVGYPYRPIRPRRPVFPIYPVPIFPPPGFGRFGFPFFGFGFGWGLNSGLWPYCGPYLNWTYGCAGSPYYDYDFGYNSFSPGPGYTQPQMEIENQPVYFYGEANSQFVQLYMSDGTVYNVTDYWLVNGELHFKMVEENGTKLAEHTIDFSQLDLQKTIDVNTARGFRFVLRNEPLQQYLKDYPFTDAPGEAPAAPNPTEP